MERPPPVPAKAGSRTSGASIPGRDGTLPGESIGFDVSFGPPGLAGASKSGPGPEDLDTPPPPPLVACGEAPPWPLGLCPLGVSGPDLVGPAASVRSTGVLERSFWICSKPRSIALTPPRISHPPPGTAKSATRVAMFTVLSAAAPTLVPPMTPLAAPAPGMKFDPMFNADSVAAATGSSAHLCQPSLPAL